MTKQLRVLLALAAIGLTAVFVAKADGQGGGPRPRPVIYVTGQGLYYDSIVTADPIPAKGRFQLLEMGTNGLETEYGPGDTEYVGGRWKEDFDGDGVFHYFMCPLLPPGRTTP
jgi:hypothetical protein